MDAQTLLVGFFFYGMLEAAFRIGVLAYFAGWQCVNWKIASPHPSMLISPGYWLARNCKRVNPPQLKRIALRARLIVNYNLWNLFLSAVVFVAVVTTQHQGYVLFDITRALVVWRAVSRTFEITIAFGNDITTSYSASKLSNGARMKLALRSYFEIFLFSAAFYAIATPCLEDFSQSILASLYVGTFTNVSYVAEKLSIPHMVFLQVFATLSLVVLSIAGYIGKVKREK